MDIGADVSTKGFFMSKWRLSMCKVCVFLFSFLSSVFLYAYEIQFTGGQYKVTAVEGELQKAICQFQPNFDKAFVSPVSTQKSFAQKSLDQILKYTSVNCFLKSETQKCPMHFDEIKMIGLDKTKICRRPDLILSCNSAVVENCLQKKIDFYKNEKCKLDEIYREGQSGIVEKTDSKSGQKYKRMIDRQYVYLKSSNCVSIKDGEKCPAGFEMRVGYNRQDEINRIDDDSLAENYCVKIIEVSKNKKKKHITEPPPAVPGGSSSGGVTN